MRDAITLQRIKDIHPYLIPELTKIYDEICVALGDKVGARFVQVARTFPEQHELYLQGRTKPGPKVTNADAGQSYHNFRNAVDFCLISDKDGDGKISANEIIWNRDTDLDKDHISDWMEAVKIFVKYGWIWGASFKDYPHFEKPSKHWKELLKLYNAGKDFIPGTKILTAEAMGFK